MSIKPDDFSVAVGQILDNFTQDVQESVSAAVEQTGKKALKTVKARSPVRTGRYKKGWRKQVEKTGLHKNQTVVTIYNAKYGPLVHLLERGHQKADGGRVEGIPHVQPAYEEAERLLPELTAKAIEEAGER